MSRSFGHGRRLEHVPAGRVHPLGESGTCSSLPPVTAQSEGARHGILEARARRSGLPRDRRPRRHRAHGRRRAGPGEPARARAARGRACSRATRSRRCCRTARSRSRVPRRAADRPLLRADQLPAERARDRVHPPGLRGEGVRQPRTLRRAREPRPPTKPDIPADAPPRARHDPRLPLVRRARRRAADDAARRSLDRRGDALHVGHDRQAQGREARARRHRSRRERGAVHVLAAAVRHHARRRPRAPQSRRRTTTPRSRRSRATRCT